MFPGDGIMHVVPKLVVKRYTDTGLRPGTLHLQE